MKITIRYPSVTIPTAAVSSFVILITYVHIWRLFAAQARGRCAVLLRWWLPATFELNLPSMMTCVLVFFIQTFPRIFLRPSLRLSGPQTEQTRCLRVRRAADATSLCDCSYVTEARGASPGSQQHSAHNTSTAQHQTTAENDWKILRNHWFLVKVHSINPR